MMVGALAEQMRRRAIERRDPPVAIDTDDAGANAAKHRLNESAARFRILLRIDQITALRFELRCHRVESRGEGIDLGLN